MALSNTPLCTFCWAQARCGNENTVFKFEFWFNYAYRFSFDITIKLNVDGAEVVQKKESKSFTTRPPAVRANRVLVPVRVVG